MKNIFITLFLSVGIFLTAQTKGPSVSFSEYNYSSENKPEQSQILNFTIDQDDFVNSLLGQVNEQNIGNTIVTLENYGTRYHTKSSGVQASHDILSWWQALVDDAGRTDITVEAFNHNFTNQISVILTIPGSENPDEIVIVGGHLDCGDYWIQNNAPGADDNASGIATLTEALRVLLANDFHPKKTVQFMAYAAEEVGLFGSADIAQTYKNQSKNVLGVLQFDMTNYKGSSFDVGINSDQQHVSAELNLFLIELLEHYNSSGEHLITYDAAYCNYACSDHASWTQNGFDASFPMEAAFEDSNPNIHTPNDTFAAMNNDASHSVKFAKIALEFIVETAKTTVLKTSEVHSPKLNMAVKNKVLNYNLNFFDSVLEKAEILDVSGKRMVTVQNPEVNGQISLKSLNKGAYILIFRDKNSKTYSKKFLLK